MKMCRCDDRKGGVPGAELVRPGKGERGRTAAAAGDAAADGAVLAGAEVWQSGCVGGRRGLAGSCLVVSGHWSRARRECVFQHTPLKEGGQGAEYWGDLGRTGLNRWEGELFRPPLGQPTLQFGWLCRARRRRKQSRLIPWRGGQASFCHLGVLRGGSIVSERK